MATRHGQRHDWRFTQAEWDAIRDVEKHSYWMLQGRAPLDVEREWEQSAQLCARKSSEIEDYARWLEVDARLKAMAAETERYWNSVQFVEDLQ